MKAVSEVSFVKLSNDSKHHQLLGPCGHIFVIFFGSHQQSLLLVPNLVKYDVSYELVKFFKKLSTREKAFAFNCDFIKMVHYTFNWAPAVKYL